MSTGARKPPRGISRVITEKRMCVGCGYDLRGLEPGGVCPECGRIIMPQRKRGPSYQDHIIQAPASWLQGLIFGAWLGLIGMVWLVGSLVITLIQNFILPGIAIDPGVLWLGVLLATLAWWVAVCIITRPRPIMESTVTPPAKEWFYLRWSARTLQFFWVIMGGAAYGIVLIQARSMSPPDWLRSVAFVSAIIGLGSMPTVLVIISNLAFWASDSALGHGARTCSFATGASAFVLALLFSGISGPFFYGGGALVAGTAFWLCLNMWRFRSMADWSVRNQETTEERNARIRERAEQQKAKADAAALEIDAPRASFAPDDVSAMRPAQSRPRPGARTKHVPQSEKPEGYDLDES